MQDDFDDWNNKKKEIQLDVPHPYFSEREIWFLHLGMNIGHEQNGKGLEFLRPVVVVREFNNSIFWAIPLTRTQKESPYYFLFSFGTGKSAAILSQMRLIDARRLSHKIGDMNIQDFNDLKQKLKALLP